MIEELKLPPKSIEAEQALISAMLCQPEVVNQVDWLRSDEFYRRDHQIMFETMQDMAALGKPVDTVTVISAMGDKGLLDEVDQEYVVELAVNSRGGHNALHYAMTIRDRAMSRKLIMIGGRISEIGYGQQELPDKIDSAQELVMEMNASKASEPVSITQVLRKTIADIDKRFNNPGSMVGLSTGFADLDAMTSGLQAGQMVVVAGRPAMGKELHNDSKVLMIDGTFNRIGDVMVGQEVASIDGAPSIIAGVFPQGTKPVFRVKFSDGRSVLAGLEHQWEVMYREWPEKRVVNTEKLISMLGKKRYKNRLYIETATGDFGYDAGITIHPYLLGCILGDGGLSAGCVRFSNSDSQIIEKIKPMIGGLTLSKIPGSKYDYRITSPQRNGNWLLEALRDFGLTGKKSCEKSIPVNYLSASRESRVDLMRGMMDTDGTVEKLGSMSYSTSSEQMQKDFTELARSLGFWAKVSSRIPSYTYKGEKKKGLRNYNISLFRAGMEECITLGRKRDRLFNRTTKRERNLNIESITPDGVGECTCISVSHGRELFITDQYICTHNTTFAMNIVEHNMINGKFCLVFNLEMTSENLMMKSLSSLGSIPYKLLRSGDIGDHTTELTAAAAKTKEKDVFIDDNASLTSQQILSRAKKVSQKAGKKIDLIVVDYLQLLNDKGDGHERITRISRALKLVAKSLGCPVIALSQLNRSLEQRPEKRPVMSDLRESGAIEQDADLIIMLYRDEVYNDNTNSRGIAEAIIRKNREGECGTVYMASQLHYCRFTNLASDYRPPAEIDNKQTKSGDCFDKYKR